MSFSSAKTASVGIQMMRGNARRRQQLAGVLRIYVGSFLGPLPCIASLSLGSSRDFHMKHKQQKENDSKVEKWSLQSGDCVVMRGTTQSKWLHSVPKRANAGGRMNLTFRRAMNTGGTNK